MNWLNSEPPHPGRMLYTEDVPCTWLGLKPVHSGLLNTGNTCFLNACVQSLMHVPGFVKFLDDDSRHRSHCYSLLNCVICSLYRTYLNMSIHPAFRPTGLVNLLPRINPSFKRGSQQDADEFFVSLMTRIQDDLLLREDGGVVLDYCAQQTTAVGQIFGWWMKTLVKCGDCGGLRATYGPLTSVSLPLAGSVQQAVDQSIKEEEKIENFTCSASCLTRVGYRRQVFHTFPKVLRIVLNRFDNSSEKVHSPIVIDKVVFIGDAVYHFSSCIVHEGKDVTSGHYTCMARRPDGRLVHLNDSVVSDASESVGLDSHQTKSGVYILLYQLHHIKVHSIKRSHPVSPSKTMSPSKKKVHVSPLKKSLEKRRSGKMLTFSPRKFKKKLGNFVISLLPSKLKKCDTGEILAKPLPETGSKPPEPPLVNRRRRKLVPLSTSSQSWNEYSVIHERETDVAKVPDSTGDAPVQVAKDSDHLLLDHTYCSAKQYTADHLEQNTQLPSDNTECRADTNDDFNNVGEISQCQDELVCNDTDIGGFVPIALTANDVPDSDLPNPDFEKNTVANLRRWLQLRGIPTKGKKQHLIEKIKNCIAMKKQFFLDPKVDGGKLYKEKQQRMILSQNSPLLSDDDIFPQGGWEVFPSRDMPTNFSFGSVYHHLIETMPQMEDIVQTSDGDSSEDEELQVVHITDPFEDAERKEIRCSKKLRRGLQYVQSGFVRNIQDCLAEKVHCYKGQVRASMREKAYLVKVGISQMSGTVIKCACDDICPQGTLQRCSHISALLLSLLLHKSLNGPRAISCTSKPCTWNRGSLKRNPAVANQRQYESFKIDVKRRSTFDPRPAELQGMPSRQKINDFLCDLSYKSKSCLFESIASITYEDFSYDEEDKDIFRFKRKLLYSALENQVDELKPLPSYTGAFEVAGTQAQSSTEKWRRIRSLQCSAQPSRQINRFQSDKARKNFLRHHLWGIDAITTKGMAYGKRHESEARKKYAEEQCQLDPTAIVEECGIYLHTQHIGLSCSPDGVKKSQVDQCKLLEIKVLYSCRKYDLNQFDKNLPKKKLGAFCLKRDVQGEIMLKTNHPYYDQVQYSVGLLGLEECDFFVWTPVSNLTLHIPFNEARWLELRQTSLQFHWKYLTPEYFAMRTPRNLSPMEL